MCEAGDKNLAEVSREKVYINVKSEKCPMRLFMSGVVGPEKGCHTGIVDMHMRVCGVATLAYSGISE